MRKILTILFLVLFSNTTMAATCDAGYYLANKECKICEAGYYCPGDNSRTACNNATYSDTTGATECTPCPRATNIPANQISQYMYAKFYPHTTKLGCYVYLRKFALENGYINYLACYIDDNGQTYGMGTGVQQCDTMIGLFGCNGGYYTNKKISGQYFVFSSIADVQENICSPVEPGYFSPSDDITRTQCPDGQTTIGFGAGADELDDCGHILHIGDNQLYMRASKRTSPSLVIQINGENFYGDMKPGINRGHLRINMNGLTYSVFNTDID